MEIMQGIGSIALLIGGLQYVAGCGMIADAYRSIIRIIFNIPSITDSSTEELDKKRMTQGIYIIVIGFVLIGISSIKYLLSQ